MGIIHEQLIGARHIQLTDLEILHTGYQEDEERTQKKFDRNFLLLERRLHEEPDDIFSHINLAVSFMTVHRYEEARMRFDRALDSAPAGQDLAIEIGARLIRAGHCTRGLPYLTRPFSPQ